METVQRRWGDRVNAEAIEAWDGPLFEIWLRFRHIVVGGLRPHGEVAMERLAPQPGQRVLDVGCGLGDTTQRLAELVGPEGVVLGIDAAPRMVETAAAEVEAPAARFAVHDPQEGPLPERFDLAFSRMGTMFFANPVVALRNVRASLEPGGRLAMVVWRKREDNTWLYKAQQIVEGIVQRPEEYEEPTCGPGPFSMANADTVTDVLLHAGFHEIALERCDIPILVGADVQEAIDLVMSIGPAGEILRLQGERAAHLHGRVREALAEGFAEFGGGDGLYAPASTWVVTARAPA